MKGAIIGDIVGSIYEHHNIKTKEFPLFSPNSRFTDDTVLTAAVAKAMLDAGEACIADAMSRDAIDAFQAQAALQEQVRRNLMGFGMRYAHAGYGGRFRRWVAEAGRQPYYSCGNGSAMRVSPAGLLAGSPADAVTLARITAVPTHNHPDGIAGAVATALCIHAAGSGDKEAVRRTVQRFYPCDFTLDEIRDGYFFDRFQVTNAGTVPYAVEAFLESVSFEDAIRNAISIGGDSDTLAAITGSIAEAYYGVPTDLWQQAETYLDFGLLTVVDGFYRTFL